MMKFFSPLMLLVLFSFNSFAENTVVYPERAWKLDQSGQVTAMYDVDSQGKAKNIRIIKSEPKFLFDDSVKAQLSKWRFPKDSPKKDVSVRINFER
ncbi:TonB family protein [Pantoea sp.]|uniref:TonB family protein n=1 Tax=Pantoea sp. TaxID=69393 RepID=UPI0031DBF689